MESTGFGGFISSNIDLDKDELDKIINNCERREVKAGQFLLQSGETSMHTYYVEKGLLRKYGINEEGKESILQFAPEKWFVTDRESMYHKRPSLYFIQALEDSKLLLIDDQFAIRMTEKFPEFSSFNNRLLHNHIHQLTNRIYQLLSYNAEDRYLEFIKTYPDILMRVPQWMVASYLGITPESLSRVRKNLAKKNFKPS
ncbi:MAG: Crp/Fnr family transcriptional regulator [Brumimicrobium sp.]